MRHHRQPMHIHPFQPDPTPDWHGEHPYCAICGLRRENATHQVPDPEPDDTDRIVGDRDANAA